MSKRNYNVFFNTHTVSGIVISVALYVMFFCGAFALFKDEIGVWEKGVPVHKEKVRDIDYDKVIDKLKEEGYVLYGRDIRMVLPEVNQQLMVSLTASKDTLAPEKAKSYQYLYLDLASFETSDYYQSYHLGEFIYRLHFLHQIPAVGMYLSGLVAVFFLFAVVTGVIVHWKKIILNFYLFRPKVKLKTVWTDAHTVLGMIGLPFQVVYAVTSSFLCLTILLLLPANFLYDGNQEKLMADLRPIAKTYPLEGKLVESFTVSGLVEEALMQWDDFSPSIVFLKNYGAANMKLQVDGLLNPKRKFLGNGRVVYDVASREVASVKNPYQGDYVEGVELAIRRLHYGDYGGLPLKILYALLAFITCFVIITGVLIWLEARNKKSVPAKQQLFNQKVGHIYLAICLSLFPVIAFSFHLSKLLPDSLSSGKITVYYTVFLGLWTVSSLGLRFKRDNYFTNKYTLLVGGILGFLIPIVNGLTSGNWIWETARIGAYEILVVDLFWLLLSSVALFIALKSKRRQPENNYKISREIRKSEITTERGKSPLSRGLEADQNETEIPVTKSK